MKYFVLVCGIFLSQVVYGFSDTDIWFVIENKTGHDLTYQMDIAANTSQGLLFSNSTLNPKTMIHVEKSDNDHILLVEVKFVIPKHETIVYYPVFFVDEQAVFPTVYQVHVELGKRKTKYSFPIHESTRRHIVFQLDVLDDVEMIRTQIPLHTYVYNTLSYQWQTLLVGIQSLGEKKEEGE
ncbi:hypothetical protein EBQ93_01105 [bacterium]|nr:hypothetical protein [bacterium]